MTKKQYIVPMIEVDFIVCSEVMQLAGGSGSEHNVPAPPRLQGGPPPGSVPSF